MQSAVLPSPLSTSTGPPARPRRPVRRNATMASLGHSNTPLPPPLPSDARPPALTIPHSPAVPPREPGGEAAAPQALQGVGVPGGPGLKGAEANSSPVDSPTSGGLGDKFRRMVTRSRSKIKLMHSMQVGGQGGMGWACVHVCF